jgi:hypothetical protein
VKHGGKCLGEKLRMFWRYGLREAGLYPISSGRLMLSNYLPITCNSGMMHFTGNQKRLAQQGALIAPRADFE